MLDACRFDTPAIGVSIGQLIALNSLDMRALEIEVRRYGKRCNTLSWALTKLRENFNTRLLMDTDWDCCRPKTAKTVDRAISRRNSESRCFGCPPVYPLVCQRQASRKAETRSRHTVDNHEYPNLKASDYQDRSGKIPLNASGYRNFVPLRFDGVAASHTLWSCRPKAP